MKILIIRFSSIGDIVLTSPVVRALKQQLPDCELHYLTKQAYRDIIEPNPHIDKGHYMQKYGLNPLLNDLANEQFDHVIDLHNNLRSWRVKLYLNKEANTIKKLNIQKWLLTNFRIDMMPEVHIVDRYLDTVAGFGVHNDGKGLEYYLRDTDRVDINSLPQSHRQGYTGFGIGAKFATKKLPVDKITELCKLINGPIILMGDKGDSEQAEKVSVELGARVFNACGKFKLNQTASLVEQSRKMISHDTGLMHIAAAFEKPIASIWGNTVPLFGMYPYFGKEVRQADLIAEVKGLSCRPCSKIGYRKCPKGHFKCMLQMDLQAVADWVNK